MALRARLSFVVTQCRGLAPCVLELVLGAMGRGGVGAQHLDAGDAVGGAGLRVG